MDAVRYKSNLRMLKVLLVISFVVSGLYLLSYLMIGISLPVMREPMMAALAQFPEEYAIAMERMLGVPQWYYLVASLLNVGSVAGLVLMWKLRKNGFHCYALSKLLLILLPIMFLDRSFVAIGDIMIAILFIVYYFVLLRMLGAFSGENDVNVSITEDNTDTAEKSDE